MARAILAAAAAAALAFASAGAAQTDDAMPDRLIADGLPLEGAPLAVAGPYAVVQESAGPANTLFRPANLSVFPQDDTLPVVLWGNGGCTADGRYYRGFLQTVASHGFLVVTTAAVPGEPDTATAEDLIAGLDWALAEAARPDSPLAGKIDGEHVAIMGQSCGGVIALQNAHDPRIDTVVVWNSGIELDFFRRKRFLADLRGPTLYIDGGESEIPRVHRMAQANFNAIDDVPVFYGSLTNGGHSGTFFHPGGGMFANIAADWLAWTLKGDEAAGATFVGQDCSLCSNETWDIQRKGL